MELEGRIAMISGGSRGLGEALAWRFAREGAEVSICGRSPAELDDVARRLRANGHRCLAVRADVTSAVDIEAWLERTRAELGPPDVFVNNASLLGLRVSIESYPPDEWRRVLEVNLTGAFLCARALVPALRETRGCLINVSSGVGDHGRPLWGAYSVSKNGVEALSQILAGELEADGVRVHVVDPGKMRTEMRAAAYPEEDPATLPTPDEVTDVFVYLASDRAREVTGLRLRAMEFPPPDLPGTL
ncbi:MAG: SDR family NAD(P)-dependent oxidoreductase [Gemmatimonadota bacterium]